MVLSVSMIIFQRLTSDNKPLKINSKYLFIHYSLASTKQSFTRQHKHGLLQFQIELTVFAINQSISSIDFTQQPTLRLPQTPESRNQLIYILG